MVSDMNKVFTSNFIDASAKRASAKMTILRQLFVTAGLLFCLVYVNTANAEFNIRHVDAVEAAEILQNNKEIKILDVRTGVEFRRGHLENAVNLNYYSRKFVDNLNKLDKDVTWLIHCRSGVRSGKTIPFMKAAGFTNVINVKDGILGWKKAGLPLIK